MDVISAPASTWILVLRLVLAAALGAAVGVNRELRAKPAGLRTHALVALGSGLSAIIALMMTPAAFDEYNAASRVIQGIVAGVGFIGGGVILRREDEKGVHGLSTAASIWVVSAIGVAAGFGLWRSAVTSVLLALVILSLGRPVDRVLRPFKEGQPGDER
jgi:putative Mg2+ transporter-C (MgtC) family protein